MRRTCLLGVVAAALMALSVSAAQTSFYDVFTNRLSTAGGGLITTASLVDTNNFGPPITNQPISLAKFREGELVGIKLGMTMSEVVSAWGKPHLIASHCVFGPRFWYRHSRDFGDVSLSFKDDELVLIAITGRTASNLSFDNGLSGQVGERDYEALLGEPSVRDPEDPSLFNGQIAYRTGPLRTDFRFAAGDRVVAREHLLWASVRIGRGSEQLILTRLCIFDA